MSKRFGRNQKRAMRQQLEQAESNLERNKIAYDRDARMYRQNMAEMERYFKDTAKILGDDFIAARRQMGFSDMAALEGRLRIHERPRISITDFMAPMDIARTVAIKIHELEFNGKQVRIDELRGQIMIRYHTPHGDAGITLSHEAWMNTPIEIIAREISADIARFIVKRLEQIRGKVA